jgi:hypothetical protein
MGRRLLLFLLSCCVACGARPVRVAAPAHGAEAIGTWHPLVFQAADPNGRWVTICQARADTDHDGSVVAMTGHHGAVFGDMLVPYFVRGAGPGEQLDFWVASDPSGRHVAFVKGEQLQLLDADTGRTEVIAGADVRFDLNPFGPSRVASFDAAGTRLLYMRKNMAVVRDLASGVERTIDPGAGALYRASFDPDGAWIVLDVIAEDTNHDGKLEWPMPNTTLVPAFCRGEVMSYGVYGEGSGDTPVKRVARLDGPSRAARDVRDLLRPLGASLLLRKADGALVLEGASGEIRELVPAQCKARLLDADGAHGQILAACTSRGRAAPAVLYGPAGAKPLGGSFELFGDAWRTVPRRFSSRDNVLVDFDTGTAHVFAEGVEVLHVSGGRVLVRAEERLMTTDLHGAAKKPLLFQTHHGDEVHTAGDVVAVEGPTATGVIDVAKGIVLGAVPGEVFAVRRDGRVLVPEDGTVRRYALHLIPPGPARWVAPR